LKKKKRILFGAVDIGWRIEHYSKFIAKEFPDSLEADSFVKFKLPEAHYKTSYTYHLQYHKYPKLIQWIWSFGFFIFALFRYDIFYFLSGETLLTRKLLPFELKLYRLLGKRIVMHFVGADIRNSEMLIWQNNNPELYFSGHTTQSPDSQTKWQKELCKLSEATAGHILVSSPDLLSFFTQGKAEYLPVFLDKDKFLEEYHLVASTLPKDKNKITILHAPSNSILKGTDYIQKILKELLLEFDDLELIVTTDPKYKKSVHPPYSVTRYELLRLYSISDIIIDQIIIGWYGLQSVEGLLLEKEVVCYVKPDLQKYFPQNGIIHTSQKGLKQSIIEAIFNIRTQSKDKAYAKSFVDFHQIEHSRLKQILKELSI